MAKEIKTIRFANILINIARVCPIYGNKITIYAKIYFNKFCLLNENKYNI
jgi:hypothetical protein